MIAERLSARHLILQYSLAVYALECNYNYIIDGRSGQACTVYMYLVWNVERSRSGFENEGRGKRWLRNMPWACQDASANIKSSWDESVKVSQLAMTIDVLHKALSSSILSSHLLQVFKATSYAWECWLVWYHYWLVIEWPFITFLVHWLL